MSKKTTYRIADGGAIIPICQRCGKSTSFYTKEYPDNFGCQCTNPIISQVARNLQNKRCVKVEGKGWHGDTPGHREAALKSKNEGLLSKPISIGAGKKAKEYLVCVRYKAHCSLDAAANLEESLQGDADFLQIESVTLAGKEQEEKRNTLIPHHTEDSK